ncbi:MULTISPECIES: M90 family metallopeptidase [unclassified Spirosoma]|uniref:M90 family metallopeptidase n=1 Tax=unclassified Spirosoma TaxID=2621999 RepID=UPI00095B1987|nr:MULTISPECIES: M90 family metallopeptidase [unclassified Spirosoma]MBN8823787.1 zinc-dependent peptidase [Spirosoma sp.]OJW79813.1 MAG: peptidase [Spirosoma sp. 48-14]
MVFLISIPVLLLLGWVIWQYARPRTIDTSAIAATYPQLLQQHVAYYRSLPDDRKKEFEKRVAHFLSTVRIEGVGTTVDELDKVLVASSAIIPIFGFTDWYYPLTNVLLYADRFNEDYQTEGDNRMILGMVGEGGALQSTMVLSKPALHEGFANKTSKGNTGIHEFVHLLDKVDGATDGLPEYLLEKDHIKPWLQLIHKSIQDIRANRSDIDPYGITNEAEFFAVVSEYFFKRPDLLQEKHPALFARLEEIFHQNPLANDKTVS